MRTHELKCWPKYFKPIKSGEKTFEIRIDDRGFAVGDVLHLREYDIKTKQYTGNTLDVAVTYIYRETKGTCLGELFFFSLPGVCIMAIERLLLRECPHRVCVHVNECPVAQPHYCKGTEPHGHGSMCNLPCRRSSKDETS